MVAGLPDPTNSGVYGREELARAWAQQCCPWADRLHVHGLSVGPDTMCNVTSAPRPASPHAGQVAVVAPFGQPSADALQATGPQLAQAWSSNSVSVAAVEAFGDRMPEAQYFSTCSGGRAWAGGVYWWCDVVG